MTEDEIIAVVQAFKDGKRIEQRHTDYDHWVLVAKPLWNFDRYDYRVAELKWRDVTIDDLKRAPLKCRVSDGGTVSCGWLVGYMLCHGDHRWLVESKWYCKCQVQDED